jgi:hypothetical protein
LPRLEKGAVLNPLHHSFGAHPPDCKESTASAIFNKKNGVNDNKYYRLN